MRRSIKFRTTLYLDLIICIFHEIDVGLFIVWIFILLTIWVILSDHQTFLFLVTKISLFLLQLGTFNLHVSRLSTFKVDDHIAFLLIFLFESRTLRLEEYWYLFSSSSSVSTFWTWGLLHHMWIHQSCLSHQILAYALLELWTSSSSFLSWNSSYARFFRSLASWMVMVLGSYASGKLSNTFRFI